MPCHVIAFSSTSLLGTIFHAVANFGSFEISFNEYDKLNNISSLYSISHKLNVMSKDLHLKKIRICRSYESSHSPPKLIEEYFTTNFRNNLLEVEYLELDSQCKYGLIARGDAQAYIRLKPTSSCYKEKIWVLFIS